MLSRAGSPPYDRTNIVNEARCEVCHTGQARQGERVMYAVFDCVPSRRHRVRTHMILATIRTAIRTAIRATGPATAGRATRWPVD